jgi:hypothetical protein
VVSSILGTASRLPFTNFKSMLLKKIHQRPTFVYKYVPQGGFRKPHLHLAFAFATVQLLFFLRSQSVLHRSMDHGKRIVGDLPEENLPPRRRLWL